MTNDQNTLTAAAARFARKIGKLGNRHETDDAARQRQAYSYWADTPEVRFASIWVGRAMGRARLFAGLRADDGSIEEAPEDHPAVPMVAGIAGGPTGQAQLLEQSGPHLVVAGEEWIVVEPDEVKDRDTWSVVAVTEKESTRRRGSLKFVINDREVLVPPADDENPDPDAPLAIRIWTPHPEKYARADSPVMSSFTILDELRLLGAAVAAIAKSRLIGRGLLGLPAGAKLPTGDDLMEFLMEVAMTAYKDPDSAAATVPIMIELPKDAGDIKRITFESEFDEIAIKLREEAIRRFATASDTPAEVLLGTAGINHWGQWAIKDEAITVGVEPRLATICDGLTRQWLWPALEGKVDDPERALVWYDTSGLRVRTNKSQTALELAAGGYITPKAVRREAGFDEDDAPPELPELDRAVEIVVNMVQQAPSILTQGQASLTELVEEIRNILPSSNGDGTEASPNGDGDGREIDLPVDETDAPPEDAPGPSDETPPDASEADVLAAAVDQVVVRALERAGHRLVRARGRSARSSSPERAHVREPLGLSEIDALDLLDDAWERVPEIATRYGVEPRCLVDTLDQYARDLLLTGAEHQHDVVHELLQEASCVQARSRDTLHLAGKHDQSTHAGGGGGRSRSSSSSDGAREEARTAAWDEVTEEIHAQGPGNCYQAAGTLILRNAPLGDEDPGGVLGLENATVVHAEVAGRGKLDGRRFGHAWVEAGDKKSRTAYDYSSGSEAVFPADVYRMLGDAKDVREYPGKEAMAKMAETGHFGPWDET